MNLPCRIYAPVGSHEELLAYLVRRLLENGANSSFVNRIQDETLPIDEIIADPAARLRGVTRIPTLASRCRPPCSSRSARTPPAPTSTTTQTGRATCRARVCQNG